ncbi:MAG: hypothetical protein AABY13_03305, partial [Nanoarchaeota archaeon]
GTGMAAHASPFAFVLWLLIRTTVLAGGIASTFVGINVMMAVLNLLPIPPLDGTRVFFVSRLFYAVAFGAVLAGGLTYVLSPAVTPLLLIIITMAGAIVAGVGWHYAFEK